MIVEKSDLPNVLVLCTYQDVLRLCNLTVSLDFCLDFKSEMVIIHLEMLQSGLPSVGLTSEQPISTLNKSK